MENPLVVEFFGLPASGKSTLCEGLEQRFTDDSIPVTNETLDIINRKGTYEGYVFMVGYALFTVFQCPIRSTRLVSIIRGSEQQSIGDEIRLSIYCLFLHTVLRRSEEREAVHLLDQGIFQTLWSIALTGGSVDRSTLQSIYQQFPVPNTYVLVRVEVDADRSMHRLAGRDGNFSRVELLLEDKSVDAVVTCERAYELVEGLVENRKDSRIYSEIRIETSEMAKEESVEEVYSRIRLDQSLG